MFKQFKSKEEKEAFLKHNAEAEKLMASLFDKDADKQLDQEIQEKINQGFTDEQILKELSGRHIPKDSVESAIEEEQSLF